MRYTVTVRLMRLIPKTLWTQFAEFVIVRFSIFVFPDTAMKFRKFSALPVLLIVFAMGCDCLNSGTRPSNPYAQNPQIVAPPSTFSSQEMYIRQQSESYVPQTPASTFPASEPAQTLSDVPLSGTVNNSSEKASLFTPEKKESDWTAVDVAASNQTAFQAMEAKVYTASGGTPADTSEALIVGTSLVVTTITDESSSAPGLPEPALLYSGKLTE